MEILKPELVWVDSRCYRKIPVRDIQSKPYEEEYLNNPISEAIEDGETYKDLLIKFERNVFWISISVPKALIGLVRGKFDRNKLMIEEATRTTLKVPPRNKDEDIIITGENRSCVGDAYRRIEGIVMQGRWKMDFTHFISIPFNDDNIVDAFIKFREDVLSTCKNVRGLDRSIFQEPKKMHLTITPLVLLDINDKKKAEVTLRKCGTKIHNILGSETLKVNVKGIEYMNDDPAEVDVLYAKVNDVDDDNCLQLISDALMNGFVESSLAKQQYDKVKIHVTLINTTFGRRENPERMTFDSRPLLEKYEDYDFGEMLVKEIHISARHTTNADGYYIATKKISLL